MNQHHIYIDYVKKDDYLRNKPKKSDQYFEISYLVTGERKYIIDDTIYKITSGMILLTQDHCACKTSLYDTNYYERIILRFQLSDLDFIKSMVDEHQLLALFDNRPKILKLDYHKKERLEGYLREMLHAKESQSQYESVTIPLLLCQCLVLLNEHINEAKQNDDFHYGEINPKISEIIMYINQHYADDITLNCLSQKFFISPFYLAKLFKQTTGYTIVQYLNSLRIKKSKEQLVRSNDKIIDIAYRVGFNSHTHFTRVFTQICNESPNSFRKRHYSMQS